LALVLVAGLLALPVVVAVDAADELTAAAQNGPEVSCAGVSMTSTGGEGQVVEEYIELPKGPNEVSSLVFDDGPEGPSRFESKVEIIEVREPEVGVRFSHTLVYNPPTSGNGNYSSDPTFETLRDGPYRVRHTIVELLKCGG